MTKFILHICLLVVVLIASCRRDVETPKTIVEKTSSTVNINFNNMFDTLDLLLDSSSYVLDNGDKFKVTTYKYYISNIKLIGSDNSVFVEEDSYHLINESSISSQSFMLENVPFKNYTSMEFMIGVDSLHNVSGSQSGELSPNYGMFWTWNTGYIQAKLEGSSQQSGAADKSIAFHIGGFKGANNPLKTITLNFNGSMVIVQKTNTPTININCNIKEWFINPNAISFSNVYSVSSVNATSKLLADNYADMFTIHSIQN